MIETRATSNTALRSVIDGAFEVFLDEEMGRGGLSVVYRGREIATRRPVAIKRLHERFRNSPVALRRFNNEGRMTSFVSQPTPHPHIVGYLGHFLAGPWLVMELIEGRTLKSIVEQEGPLEMNEAVRMLTGVCSALDHIHRLRVVHLDLKPQNLLLTPEGSVKLIDFGLAQEFAHRQDRVGEELFGTAAYLAPEQVNKEPVGRQTDIYSLGCVFHELVTGRPPFEAPGLTGEEEQLALIELHRHAEPVPPSLVRPDLDLPAWVDDVVGRAMEKQQADRFESGGAFAAAAVRGLNATSKYGDRFSAGTTTLLPRRQSPDIDDRSQHEQEDIEEERRGPGFASRIWSAGGNRLRQSPNVRHVLWRMCLLLAIVTMTVGINVAGTDGLGSVVGHVIGVAPGMRVEVVIDDLNVRADHRADSPVIATLPLGSEVVVTGLPESGTDLEWWPVKLTVGDETVSGWVWSEGLDDTPLMKLIAFPGETADRVRSVGEGIASGWDVATGWWPLD